MSVNMSSVYRMCISWGYVGKKWLIVVDSVLTYRTLAPKIGQNARWGRTAQAKKPKTKKFGPSGRRLPKFTHFKYPIADVYWAARRRP